MKRPAARRSTPRARSWRRGTLVAALAALAAALPLVAEPGYLPAAVAAQTVVGRTAGPEVWQVPQPPHQENPTNPLANRLWGVYQGPQDQVSAPYAAATGTQKELIGRIALRPRTKWYGSFVADDRIRSTVTKYIAASQRGNPQTLVQLAVFRMKPWEREACTRAPTRAEQDSYRRWVNNLAAGIGGTPALVVMQPDGPFLWCTPNRALTSGLLRFATRTLSALPHTSVYIDAGAADWCENNKGHDPERCAGILKRAGIGFARGFALDSTHYMGAADNIRQGAAINQILVRDGYGAKHFIVDTAKSGVPTPWADVIPATPGGLKDNARTCTTATMTRCVTLGIPPTARPGETTWLLPDDVRILAARQVDGFVWFGRPWLYNQADPFVAQRAVDMARTTPWPAPSTGPVG